MEKLKSFITHVFVPIITVITGALVVYVDINVADYNSEIGRMEIALKSR
ncbi:hypothetical protein QUF80_12655 [Desulfococcaceae bacterium HSG8]|nr:hypothetical protein [Desulfococcaceae bacterium HSG8]